MKIDRRRLVASLFASFAIPASAHGQANDSATISAWMDSWISQERGAAVGNLHLSRFVEPIYYLLKPIVWLPDETEKQLKPVNVPVGFVTDFASIPRLFWSILPPDGKYTHPAIVHDFLYWTQRGPREEADQILRVMMEDFSVGTVTVNAIYSAVRTFGGSAWDTNRKLRANGERRILKIFPEDPLMTWDKWKQRPGVFADASDTIVGTP